MISVTGNIPASELIVVGGDLNGHIGTNGDRYDAVHGGYGFGERNADGERILEFCDAMELIVTNTCYYYYRVLRAICCQPVDGSLICFM